MQIQVQGIHHIALVCKDIDRTIDFYTTTLGFNVTRIHALSDGIKHYSFAMNNGVEIAFFWFPNAPESAPGIASVKPDAWQTGDISTAQGSMNHLAFTVSFAELEAYREQLVAQGIFVTPVLHHKADRSGQTSESNNPPDVSSFYFFDPNGILLEFAANVCESINPLSTTSIS
jgi:catechol 2,3-dioxygenase-like lactoylglutathione lyase family enzyme